MPRWRPRPRLSDDCQREASAVAAKAPYSILICGEAWDLSQASSTFDVVLSTAFSSDYVYLPVAAAAFGELVDYKTSDLLLPKPKGNQARRRHLYYRCRPHRERFTWNCCGKKVLRYMRSEDADQITGDFVPKRFSERWHDDAIAQYASYKFVVAFENDDKAGYVTRKLALRLPRGCCTGLLGPRDGSHLLQLQSYVRCHDLEECARRVKQTTTTEPTPDC